jgi:hypothetical protein
VNPQQERKTPRTEPNRHRANTLEYEPAFVHHRISAHYLIDLVLNMVVSEGYYGLLRGWQHQSVIMIDKSENRTESCEKETQRSQSLNSTRSTWQGCLSHRSKWRHRKSRNTSPSPLRRQSVHFLALRKRSILMGP